MKWLRAGASSGADGDISVGGGGAPLVERVVGAGAETFALVRERAAALRLTGDARVSVPERVLMRPGGVVVAILPRIEGMDLDALLASRGHLSVGECVYLGQQLCGALASLHERGIFHGDVSPANVMIGRSGLILVDTVAGALPEERGTEGFRAPERADGASRHADIYSVGAILAVCIDPAQRVGFMGWLDPLLDEQPESRPSARGVERGLTQCAYPVQISLPDTGLVGELRAHASEPHERTTVLRSSRPWRARRLALRLAGGAVVALAVGGAAAYVYPSSDSAVATSPGQYSPELAPVPVPLTAPESEVESEAGAGAGAGSGAEAGGTAQGAATAGVGDAEPGAELSAAHAARALTNARFAALAQADPEALVATGATDSPASARLQAQARAIEDGDLRFEDVQASVISATEVPGERGEGVTRVAVTYVVSAHTVWHRDGTGGELVPTKVAAHREDAWLDLRLAGATWLVERVLPQS
ncbi:protein kinase domain-containing protein [Demequina aurantiaca]|uniref:protein kinase domain-containing protein n=1 Tax=Demequina aurantiaca TaxID=676200 RepID=UPI003D34E1C9